MNKKTLSLLSLIILAALVWLLNYSSEKKNNLVENEVINRYPNHLIFTKHARCRMDCRFFTEKEVREILEKGTLNSAKSKPYDKPCPSYAFEGITSDGQEARMIFASCDNQTVKVVTCIDLENQYQCNCN